MPLMQLKQVARPTGGLEMQDLRSLNELKVARPTGGLENSSLSNNR